MCLAIADERVMTDRTGFFIFFSELRRSLQTLLLSISLVTVVVFFASPRILQYIQEHLAEKLYFFSVAGPFLAHVKISLFAAVYLLMPWLLFVLWRALGASFRVAKEQLFWFVLFTSLLFYAGTVFCYFVTLPFGINFLLGFGSEELKPVISIGRFVTFITLFLLAFGVIFEVPVFMVFMARVGMTTRSFFTRNRRYAVLLIAILAALLTPTPDVVNMLLMGGPLYLLYEAGIVLLKVMQID